MKKILIAVAVLALAFIAYQLLKPNNPSVNNEATSLISPSPENAAVFILEPGDGAVVSSPLTVKFGIAGMTVAPAGQNTEHSGHHHLLIDMDEPVAIQQPLPASDQLIHFGAGQTQTELELEPGVHTLQLLLGNYLHIPHDPPVFSKKITITVE